VFGVIQDGLEQQFGISVHEQLLYLHIEECKSETVSKEKEDHFVLKYKWILIWKLALDVPQKHWASLHY
jgi:hypothetical protein